MIATTDFELGDNEVAISADGYKDRTITVQKEKPATPAVTKTELNSSGNYALTFDILPDAWKKAAVVMVNGTSYEEFKNYGNPGTNQFQWYSYGKTLTLDKSAFTKDINEIKITSGDYDELIVKLNKDGSVVMDDAEDTTLKEPSTVQSASKSQFYSFWEIRFKGDGYLVEIPDGVIDYLDAVTGITVNGTAYSICGKTESFPDGASTKYMIKNGAYTDVSICYGGGAFKAGTNNVVITAIGYKTLTVTLDKDGNLVK